MKIEVRAGNAVHIEGYVNAVERDSHVITVPSIGQCVEQIKAGVFDKALSSGADVSILENHDNSRRLGSISEGNLKLYEDNIGLRAIADIVDADIADKARRHMLKGWSFGFICTENEIEKRAGNVPRRIVKGMMLSEVSLIDGSMKPCYSGTSVEVRADGFITEFRAIADDNIEYVIPDSGDNTPTDAENAPVDSTADGETVETRSEEPDYSYYDAMLRYLELRYNPYHDDKGRFCSGGGGGGVMYVPNKKKGEKGMSGDGSSFYIGMSDRDIAEQALANEFEKWAESKNTVPAEIQAKVQKVRDMASKNSPFGDLEGDIQVSRDEDGNYNLSYTQVRKYGRLKSATIGVGDIPARKETTHTTYVLNDKGMRIKTIRKTDTVYDKQVKASSDDWTGGNANTGTSRTAKRKMSNAMKWADTQMRHRAVLSDDETDPEPV